MGTIILDGKEHNVDAKTCLWDAHNMTWRRTPNVTSRELDPDLIIWHWTGGENSAETFYSTLNNRDLGITFYVDREGVIWQFVDPEVYDPRDTGGRMGRRSISIEIANYGFRRKVKHIPKRGRDRVTDDIMIHGMRLTVARFYDHQIKSVAALTKRLCAALDIPMKFPRDSTGKISHSEMPNRDKRHFSGIIGHYHKTNQKTDPGFHLFDELGHLEDLPVV